MPSSSRTGAVRKQNSYCLKEKLHSELYAEIDRMDPVFRHLLEAQLRGVIERCERATHAAVADTDIAMDVSARLSRSVELLEKMRAAGIAPNVCSRRCGKTMRAAGIAPSVISRR